jgi:hypothetical protein
MAAFHGKAGRVQFAAGTAASVLSWSIDAAASVEETTVMSPADVAASAHWKTYLAGYKTWSATVECLLDESVGFDPSLSADLQDGDGDTLVLYASPVDIGARKYSGTAIVTGIASAIDKDGVAQVTYTYQGSGTLTVAASDYDPTP